MKTLDRNTLRTAVAQVDAAIRVSLASHPQAAAGFQFTNSEITNVKNAALFHFICGNTLITLRVGFYLNEQAQIRGFALISVSLTDCPMEEVALFTSALNSLAQFMRKTLEGLRA